MLKAKIVEKGESQKSVAMAIGISENSLSRKIAGKREFRLSEVLKLCDFLKIDNPIDIFFTSWIPNMQRIEEVNLLYEEYRENIKTVSTTIYDRITELCEERKTTITAVCRELKLSRSIFSEASGNIRSTSSPCTTRESPDWTPTRRRTARSTAPLTARSGWELRGARPPRGITTGCRGSQATQGYCRSWGSPGWKGR